MSFKVIAEMVDNLATNLNAPEREKEIVKKQLTHKRSHTRANWQSQTQPKIRFTDGQKLLKHLSESTDYTVACIEKMMEK